MVRSIARTEGVSMDELENISGTGVDGRVTKKISSIILSRAEP
ncbi:MAG: E3 binding domain-containing protein [Calditrichia bacterium]